MSKTTHGEKETTRSGQLKAYKGDIKHGGRAESPHDKRPVILAWCDHDFGPFKKDELVELWENLAVYNRVNDVFEGGWWLVRAALRASATVALPSAENGWPMGTSPTIKGMIAPRF